MLCKGAYEYRAKITTMENSMTSTDKAIYLAAKAIVHHYDLVASINSDMPPPPQEEYEQAERAAFQQEAQPLPTSQGVPVCARHGKAMRLGKFGSYFCSSRENDPRYANKSGYCSAKG